MIRAMILDSYDWFVGMVDERRPLSTAPRCCALADGSVFTGRQALQNKLVDELGGENEAVGWLATKGVDADLKVIEWKPTDDSGGRFLFCQAMASRRPGCSACRTTAPPFCSELGADRLFLDGLVSVWHP